MCSTFLRISLRHQIRFTFAFAGSVNRALVSRELGLIGSNNQYMPASGTFFFLFKSVTLNFQNGERSMTWPLKIGSDPVFWRNEIRTRVIVTRYIHVLKPSKSVKFWYTWQGTVHLKVEHCQTLRVVNTFLQVKMSRPFLTGKSIVLSILLRVVKMRVKTSQRCHLCAHSGHVNTHNRQLTGFDHYS